MSLKSWSILTKVLYKVTSSKMFFYYYYFFILFWSKNAEQSYERSKVREIVRSRNTANRSGVNWTLQWHFLEGRAAWAWALTRRIRSPPATTVKTDAFIICASFDSTYFLSTTSLPLLWCPQIERAWLPNHTLLTHERKINRTERLVLF